MIVGSGQVLWKKYYCAAFLKQMPNFIFRINGHGHVYSRFSIAAFRFLDSFYQLINTKNLYFSIQIANS
jgi:hypothetical protein